MKFPNNLIFLVLIAVFTTGILLSPAQSEEWKGGSDDEIKTGVEIPNHEFVGFFDAEGTYTVVGAIKNHESFSVIPTIIINIQDGQDEISRVIQYVPITPSNELPFKIRFPEIKTSQPILKEPEISYIPTQKEPTNINVIYDETLIQHEDGHLTGRIVNNGIQTVYNVKIFAIIHGFDHETLDMGQNFNMIEKLEPGEITDFQMYPDSLIADDIFYYSCFAPSDSSIVPVYSERNGNKFYYRYDSGTWYYDAEFNDKGTELTMKTHTSFPLETYTNFEFPQFAEDERFQVFLNDEPKQIIQSIDEMNNWHVAFTVEPNERGEIRITGFKQGWDPGDRVLIPDWVKFNSGWWADSKIDDKNFVRGIQFLIDEEIIKTDAKSQTETNETAIPEWFRVNAKWWSVGILDDETFLQGLEYLINRGIIEI